MGRVARCGDCLCYKMNFKIRIPEGANPNMQIDKYTKFLLTVIACCLVYLCLKDAIAIPKVHADEPVRVTLVDSNDMPLTKPAGSLSRQVLPVEVQSQK